MDGITSSPQSMGRLRLRIGGRVQGVGFRVAAVEEAGNLGLRGWVRNLPDGRVEIVAEGKRGALQMLEAWAHRGPMFARVDDLTVEWEQYRGDLGEFTIAR